MKKLLLFSLTALVSIMTNARQLTPQEALSRALGTEAAHLTASRSSALTLSYTSKDPATGNAGVYVFNCSGDNGYAVISADDVAEALLGYADEGRFDPDNIPANMKAWLETYTAEIAWASTQSSSEGISTYASGRPTRSSIAPLCKTQWNQSAPYNNECPLDPRNNQRCVTGCVATAMAQVMKYHNWPEKGTGSHSYTTSSLGIEQSLDFSSITFDWANMLDVYPNTATAAQEKAVATLMHAAGVSVDMNYTSGSSGAGNMIIATSLLDYFGYDKGLSFQNRGWYGIYEWEDLIYDNLKTCGPVIFGGQSTSGGHEFVCDGYSQDGYFHINWGWGGMSDGYFLLSALNPSQQGIGGSSSGYNIDVDAIIGIRKPVADSQYNVIFTTSENLTASSEGKRLTLNGSFFNMSLVSLNNVYCGLRITDASGNNSFAKWIYAPSGTLKYGEGYGSYAVDLDLPAGNYIIAPAFKVGEDGEWKLMTGDFYNTNTLAITVGDNGNITSIKVPASDVNLEISDIKLESALQANTGFHLTAKATNTGSQEYMGTLLLLFKDSAGKYYTATSWVADIPAGETIEIDLRPMCNVPAGDYQLQFGRSVDTFSTSNGFYTVGNPIDVTVGAYSQPVLSVTDFSIDNASGVALDNITVRMKVSNTGGFFYSSFRTWIFPENGGTSLSYFDSPLIEIPAGAKDQEVVFSGSFPSGKVGSSYLARVDVGNTQATNAIKFTVGTTTGIEEIEATGESRILDVYTLNGIRANIQADIRTIADLDNSPLAPGTYIIVTIDANGNRKSIKYMKR